MTAPYVPVKGDRVRRAGWDNPKYIDVDYVGRSVFVGYDENDNEHTMFLSIGEWIKVETPTPLPERWANFYPNKAVVLLHGARDRAEATATPGRIATVHIWTDADGVDRIERVTT